MTNLSSWLAQESSDAELAAVIVTMASACAEIADVLRSAPIAGQTGLAGATNVQGEDQKQLDVISNDIVLRHVKANCTISALVSEELDEAVHLNSDGRYMVATDPLDGSSNLDVNGAVGTIFSIFNATEGLLQPGTKLLAAGYAIYGPAMNLVLGLGDGVVVFTLDAFGTFVLTQENVRVPEATAEFAISTARERFWDEATKSYVAENVAGETGAAGKRYNMRWVGSMVADIHRILMRGGIFLYPLDSETISKGGRLRLLYEGMPMAFLLEAAGGRATTGRERLLTVIPTQIHQRIPVILGSAEEVQRIEAWYSKVG